MNNQEKNSYVRSQILKALLEMMRIDNFDSITISNLTAKAEVGRASFYRNYQTKEDVLRQEAERLNNELNNIRKNDDPTDYRLKLIQNS
ncbi:MAG: TetR/AcrR family transcriptional regulator [Lachnospiraceae bacterium]